MPVLPTVDQLPSAVFQPQRGVVQPRAGQVGQALTQAGRELQRTSERVLNHIDDTASLHARAAIVELKRAQNQLAIGEGGYAHLKNGAATTPGVVNEYETRFNDQVRALGANLSPEARQKFDGMAREQGTNFQAGVLTHIMREDLSHRGEVYAAQIGVASETMGLNYNNPDVILRERASTEATVAGYAQKNGIKDKALLERMLQDARGSGHEAIINGYLTAGQAGQAQEYFEVVRKNGGEMTPAKAKSIENMLKPEVAFETGRAIAAELFALHVGGGSASEIAAQKLKLTEGSSREVVAAVDKAFGDQVNALDQDRKDTGGEILLDCFNGGSCLEDPRLRAIRAADPTHAVSLVLQLEQMVGRKATGADDVTTMSGIANYGRWATAIRRPDIVVTEGDIMSQAHLMEDREIKTLLTLVDKQNDESTQYRISPASIKAGMPKSADSPERVAAYNGFVESELQRWKTANPGKRPAPADERAIIRAARTEHTELSAGFFYGTNVKQVPAFLATEGESFPAGFGAEAGFDKRSLVTGFAALKVMLPEKSDTDLISIAAYITRMRANPPAGVDITNVSNAEIVKQWELTQR